ncbi:pyridoxal phosphate-dependent aminotransferase [Paludibacterium purpuratum]|uniref:Putative 8-amino-7-oxononanoate synthase n=1 Tax=Paludibacterium purpuratum TaxID=1144873 RepID=A0A4R7B7Z5_9NEIS|nr:aminotransferase class I/II-fold pyridoxal phosphate-dependent enzyme [Paludibacterium purpuratum]TDR79895.1 histidinol-phosphate aminotransferase [Paludibacterium purpuratum]
MLPLHRNETHLCLSPATRAQLVAASHDCWRYPGREIGRLQQALACLHGKSADQLLLGAGSTSILLAALGDRLSLGDAVLFYGLPVYAPVADFVAPSRAFPVAPSADGRPDLARLQQCVARHAGPAVVYLSNPDGLTGEVFARDALLRWVASAGTQVFFIVDEAYIEFMPDHAQHSLIGRQSALPPNLMVLRTFSKARGMAGLRIGYGVSGDRPLLSRLGAPLAAGLNLPGLLAALDALEDDSWLDQARFLLDVAREALLTGLVELRIRYRSGPTNFVLHAVPGDTVSFQARMRSQGFLLAFPLPGWCRVSVGSYEAVQSYLTALRRLCA